MSFLYYNGVGLNLLKTNSVERIPKLSDDGIEYVHTEFTINITAIYNPASGATTYAPNDGSGPVYSPGSLPMVTDSAIRHYLMQPRRPLIYQEGGIDIVRIPQNLQNGGAIDAYNGPVPQACIISRIAGSRMFFVNYTIKCFVIECPPETECLNYQGVQTICCALVSNRYSRTETLDDQYRSMMTVSGAAYFRSDVLAQFGVSADYFRAFLIPPRLRGYVRRNIQFVLSPNGTYLEYNCVDVENFKDLGSIGIPGTAASVGITDLDLRYSTSSLMGGNGPVRVAEYGASVNVTASAKGMKAANTLHMTWFLMALCVQKLGNIFKKLTDGKRLGTNAGTRITEDVFRKEVTVSMDYLIANTQQEQNEVLAMTGVPIEGWIGESPQGPFLINLPDTLDGANPEPPFANGTRGTAAYQLAVKEFASACYCSLSPRDEDGTGNSPTDDSEQQPPSWGNGPPSVQGIQPPDLPDPTPYNISPGMSSFRSFDDPDRSMYLECDIQQFTSTDTGLIALSVATRPPTSLGDPSTGNGPPPPNSPDWYNTISNVIIRTFNPSSRVVVNWSMTRSGCVPEIPDPAPRPELDSYYTLIRRSITPMAIEFSGGGGSIVYRAKGVYEYATRDSVSNQAVIPFPIPPNCRVRSSQLGEFAMIQGADYLQDMINNPTDTENSTA